MTKATEFLCDSAGAVTIDWVALGSAILLLGIMAVYGIFNDGVAGLVDNVNSTLNTVSADVTLETVNIGGTGTSGGCTLTKSKKRCR